jgi:transcription elongation GreA/GreB family factor
MVKSSLKHQLYNACSRYVDQRIQSAQQAIDAAQESANDETKSSAGDKYETGRAMAQLEIEKNRSQLAEANKLKQVLTQINPDSTNETIQSGSLAITTHGKFYISIAAGSISINNESYFAISPASPIAQKLLGLKTGEEFTFNGKNFTVEKIN